MKNFAARFALVTLASAVALTASAQQQPAVSPAQPRIANAKLQTRSAAAGLEKEFRAILGASTEPAWIGYAVPTTSEGHMCCWNGNDNSRRNCCGRCGLERDSSDSANNCKDDASLGTVKLEAPRQMLVLFRTEQRVVGKIRTFSEDCEIDAGGLPVYWLTEVKPTESIALLTPYARMPGDDSATNSRHLSDGALVAIALHADPAADRALETFAAPGAPEHLREQSIFWLGAARGQKGFEILKRIGREDASDRIREKVVFALYVSKQPGAADEIIRVARDDSSSRVRGQALFWLAQKAGAKAAGAITSAIENDPDTEVKKRAVFALSQLPKDDGVPKLIQVARTNKNPAVRKQAMFWLGQSNDPRALAFFEEILRQ